MNKTEYVQMLYLLEDLKKVDKDVLSALSEARKAVPDAGKKLAKHIFTDTLCPWVGNRFAYNDFLGRNKDKGIHVSVDLNSFSVINDKFGHLAGDEALKKFFKVSSEISRSLKGKNFRVGGDENRLYFDSPEKATVFAKELDKRLSQEHVNDHKLSAAVGIGFSPEHAEQALKLAKDKLGPMVEGERVRKYAAGNEPTTIHSLLDDTPHPKWTPGAGKEDESGSKLKVKNPLK